MDIWHIRGGRRLCGTASVQGAKNAVLPILAASVLTGCETRLSNCPDLMDVDGSVDILRRARSGARYHTISCPACAHQ